jgi:hypothetical protein
MEADIGGNQRKVVRSRVRPVRSTHGTEGIAVRDSKTLPFVMARGWNAPAGYYPEAFYIVVPGTGEVYYESPSEIRLIWGLPSVTDVDTEVSEPIDLPPGTYQVVFALGGVKGGETTIEVFEVGTQAA